MPVEQIDDAIAATFEISECWIVGGKGAFAFRYGPFEQHEVGPLMERAIEEGVGLTFILQRGREIDWAMLKELCPAKYPADDSEAAE